MSDNDAVFEQKFCVFSHIFNFNNSFFECDYWADCYIFEQRKSASFLTSLLLFFEIHSTKTWLFIAISCFG